MNYILALILFSLSTFSALVHLGQGADRYYDFVALVMVLGGTVAVSLVLLPWRQGQQLRQAFKTLLYHRGLKRKEVLQQCLLIIQARRSGSKDNLLLSKELPTQILQEGLELLDLGFDSEKIRNLLFKRIDQTIELRMQIPIAIKALSKYPPAFGLAGTVFGLVELMNAVAAGMAAEQTGLKMAIALVATLYGLLMANMIVNPAGEHLTKILQNEAQLAEISVQAILLIKNQTSLLEAQEVLNSYVLQHERIDVMNQAFESMEAVA